MRRSLLYILVYILISLPCFIRAQKNNSNTKYSSSIDSLLKALKTTQNDTLEVNILSILCKEHINLSNYEQAMEYATLAQQKSEKLNFKKGVANSFNSMGHIQIKKGLYDKGINLFSKSLKIFQEIDDKKGIAKSYNNIGVIYWNQGNFEMALSNYLRALKIREQIGDKPGIAGSYTNIGIIYENQHNYEMALEKYFKSLKIQEEIGDDFGVATSFNNIGIIYFDQLNFKNALENHFKSLKIKERIGDRQGMAYSYVNIGNVYEKQGNNKNALDSYLKSLKINEEIGDKLGLASSYNCIGNVYRMEGNYKESYRSLYLSVSLFKEIGNLEGIKEVYSSLSNLYESNGDYKQAYNYYNLYSNIKDTLLNEQSNRQIAEMNTKYDSEKKDKELIRKDAEISKQQAETEKQNLQRNAFIIGFALVLVLAFFIFRSYRQKQTANGLLEEKNNLIETQKQLVEEKNIKITDSINYAKRIQQAILPPQALIKSVLPESFIFFRPKDIVSGDFYWFSEKKDQLLFAVSDCTGHGVPGAFMSMIGNTLLNEIVNVKNIVKPDRILNELNKGIVDLLHQNNRSSTQDDGMDITILSINKTSREVEFAGANHFSYLYSGDGFETLEGDVYSIGGMFGKSDVNFTSKKIKVKKGDTVYLFTDGFIDQFGGENNSKFLSGRFEQLLQKIQRQNMELQEEKLITAFDDWKGNNRQLDDVLIVGIRL